MLEFICLPDAMKIQPRLAARTQPSAPYTRAFLSALSAGAGALALAAAPAQASPSDDFKALLDEHFAWVLKENPGFARSVGVDIDPIAVGDIRELVSHLKHRGIGVLITDHNVRETLGIIDRAYILHEGKLMMEGSPQEIVADENVRRVYLGNQFNW